MADLTQSLYTTPAMAAVFSSEGHVRQMLRFEAALAHAEARAGVIPPDAADAIAAACHVERFDLVELYREAAVAGTPAIPLVRMLTAQVVADAGNYVHWGATSQDVIDTALMLQMREGLALIEASLLRICASCAALAERYRQTLMAGRTLLQQALPIPFGLKAARWLALAIRQIEALREQGRHSLAVQFGGAAGTLAALGDRGLQVAELLAEGLGLALPDLPWHTERDRMAGVATTLGVLAGSIAKIAYDIALLAQTEVGEASELAAPGKGGSSAMPQKRNPVDTTLALASARLAIGGVPVILSAMAQEHERAIGGWQAEWAAIPDLFRHTGGAVVHLQQALEGLQVDTTRMQVNLEQSRGLLMAESLSIALALHLGRPEAQRLVQEVCRRAAATQVSLSDAAVEDPRIGGLLTQEAIAQALDPTNYLGSSDRFIDRALEAYRGL
jgi:3-carboxy-cis,cis-muconate cycloisomerase